MAREVLLSYVFFFERDRCEIGRRTSYNLGKITPECLRWLCALRKAETIKDLGWHRKPLCSYGIRRGYSCPVLNPDMLCVTLCVVEHGRQKRMGCSSH